VTTPADVRVGDRVVYSKYAGTEVTVGGSAQLVLKAEDVVGEWAWGGKADGKRPT
jgi:chaperonin GroES